jgi:hypothetical protein
MTNYLHIRISEISDPSFQSMVTELCHCVDLNRTQFEDQALSYLLMAIGKEQRTLSIQHLPTSGVLTMKLDQFPADSVVYRVCWELANLNGTHIESFDGKTVLSLIKKCYKKFCPRATQPKKSTRRANSYAFTTDLINRRRLNGDL